MVYSNCPRCRTELEQTQNHCPVCGSGDIHDPNQPNSGNTLPDLPITDLDHLLPFCDAMKNRLLQLNALLNGMDWGKMSQGIQQGNQDSTKATASPPVYYQILLAESTWLPYFNIDPITRLMRASLFYYFETFNQEAKYGLGESDIDAALIELNKKLRPRINESVAISVDLCKNYLEALKKANGQLNYTAYTFLERYVINGFGLGLYILDAHIQELKRNGGQITEAGKKYLGLGAVLLQEASTIKDTQNVPENAQDLFLDISQLANYISGVANDIMGPIDYMEGNSCIRFFELWDPRAKDEIRLLEMKNKAVYDMFNETQDRIN